MAFPITGSFAIWKKTRTIQALKAGNNTITLTTIGSNGGNFDELGISGIQLLSGIKQTNNELSNKSITIRSQNNGAVAIELVGFEHSKNVQLKMTNLMGQILYQTNRNNPTQLTINTSSIIKNAIYIVSVEDNYSRSLKKLVFN
jgi:hypothetical protein